ncbi:hypothetical protein DB30_00742 [Enhygromyxa salina]|uniref:Uncharacterized protein n=1 Tax=Enhygromyxa salina TaxID=215803 RepID=A0A0C2DFP8_9BACT|nr:hypothetical protein DB30_00742 [Enhygromyxa salina]
MGGGGSTSGGRGSGISDGGGVISGEGDGGGTSGVGLTGGIAVLIVVGNGRIAGQKFWHV